MRRHHARIAQKIAFISCAAALIALAMCPANAQAQNGASPFPDPPGYHPVAPTPQSQDVPVRPPPDPRPPRPWVSKPSPALAARLRHWQLKLEPGEAKSEPERGVFPSFADLGHDATARLVNDLPRPPAISLRPVAGRTRYVPRDSARTDPKDEIITREWADVLSGREVAQFIASERLDSPRLDVGNNLAVVLVQDFEAALRTPSRKEHVWSINWRVETDPGKPDYVGYEAWGLFTKVNGVLKPFHLAARESWSSGETTDYFYILAAGDLDGDGADEMVVREMIFEPENDSLQLWAWERGMPATIAKLP